MKKKITNIKQQSAGEISPVQYRELLSKTQLVEIYIIGFSSRIDKDKLPLGDNLSINITDNYNFTFQKDIAKALATFELNVPTTDSNEPILLIKVEYEVLMEIKENLPSEFWNIYKSVTLPIQIWPYFREFVQNTTSRMNIPPLTLPILFK
ncbi:MAG: hypothetical protein ACYDA4_14045 [Ignavibacteriaceae bacterium]